MKAINETYVILLTDATPVSLIQKYWKGKNKTIPYLQIRNDDTNKIKCLHFGLKREIEAAIYFIFAALFSID